MSLTPRIDNIDQNLIINGGFRFWQRGGISPAINTTTSYVYSAADRWLHKHTGTFTGTPNVQRSASALSNNLSEYSMQHNFRRNASAATIEHQQRVESIFARKMVAGGKCSLSLYINSSLNTGSIRVRMSNATVLDNHASQSEFYNSGLITVGTAGVWQKVELENISVSAAALNGIAVFIEYSLPSNTDGSIQNIRIAQVCLNANSKVSNFNPAGSDVVSELILCQRYYEKSYNLDVDPGTITNVGQIHETTGSSFVVFFTAVFKNQKRVTPSITAYNPVTGASDSVRTGGINSVVTYISSGTVSASFSGNSGAMASNCFAQFTADAEIN